MGSVVKVIDAIIFFFLLVIALALPLLDAQIFIPHSYYPDFLVKLNDWYIHDYGHYLMIEKPRFFVGIVFFEFIFQWPLALLNLYAILNPNPKPWFGTTCLMYGVSLSTAMAATLTEMVGSGRASAKLLIAYCPFMGLGILATLRGLLSRSIVAKSPQISMKKRA